MYSAGGEPFDLIETLQEPSHSITHHSVITHAFLCLSLKLRELNVGGGAAKFCVV